MSSTSNKRAPTTATQRLKQDYLRIKKDPVPYICAEPLPSNILEWHYVVRGPEMTPYEGIPVLDHLQLEQPECRSTSVGWALDHSVTDHDQRRGCQRAVAR
ncbi:LOW QUALITY PROTEIN: UBE2J2 isoform 15 [Pongo abelii]|uniref:UBE2J2 isoform 15 n=1 Tax=Pongo abelii TaxID=9601 RepID=A0A2J8R795_PONAB|nr:LOW QUALITY PROTEIN: UBE2J2 isoform 15 [Pongo abelii]